VAACTVPVAPAQPLANAATSVQEARECHEQAVGVAVFPEGHRDARDLDHDLEVMRAKYDAGAEFAITEMVLRSADYFGLVERARGAGIDFPIVPGIMPILNLSSMRKMVELSGREMPDEVVRRIEPLADDPAAVRAEGIRIATELCDELLAGGAPGLHFYTLNRSKATREIYQSLACHA
jgi:methylenetetrahydrofolate reductase (NADPH)